MLTVHVEHEHVSCTGLGRAATRLLRPASRRAYTNGDYRQLFLLDDYMLKDIGISRDMIDHEMRRPLFWMG